MKQLLFLLLFPCLALAQYTGNAGQKITLGEQTTADGLVFRGVENDTALITPFSDTSAYIILDTVNNRFYNYKRNTNVWTQLNILPTDTSSMLGNYWRSGKFSGVLPVVNGGTGRSDNITLIVQDQSGNFYNTVAIGTQVWFRENLRTKKYRSGALIPVKTNTDTSTLVGQRYYYNNDSTTNEPIYGALYNWRATQNSDSLCPVGWHVPTDAEWTTLTNFLSLNKGGKIKSTSTTYWNSPNVGATNESGFSALPGGYRSSIGSFVRINNDAFFWSATENDDINAWDRVIYNNDEGVYRFAYSKTGGFSVRCLKN